MSLSPHTTPSGFRLPSIHAAPPFFTQQPNPATQAVATEQWSRLILSYAKHRNLFTIKVEDAQTTGGDWDEILRNDRINRKLNTSYLAYILEQMERSCRLAFDPPKQSISAVLYWRTPEEWAEVLHEWATSTGQLNTILTFYEIIEPPVPSPLSGVPMSILRRAINLLIKSNRAQLIAVADGEGVRFLNGSTSK
ncbi:hypothetical protein QCA50_010409 [Cerrena zonata]|uniref:ESCRT-II complex vps25 subunit n=1 Tax=Cerrena zonata TaxID=2478898 RepID=A0AAW0FEF6_9APHY